MRKYDNLRFTLGFRVPKLSPKKNRFSSGFAACFSVLRLEEVKLINLSCMFIYKPQLTDANAYSTPFPNTLATTIAASMKRAIGILIE